MEPTTDKLYIFYFYNPLKPTLMLKGKNLYDALTRAGFANPPNVLHNMVKSFKTVPGVLQEN